jgi:hypothetical protein
MPFYKPYKTKFQKNDLMYGLNGKRNEYLKNNNSFNDLPDDCRTLVIDDFKVTAKEIEDDDSIPPEKYFEFLKYLEKHNKYKVIIKKPAWELNLKKFPDEYLDLDDPSDINRKCKAGLYWASQTFRNGHGFSIHFILDGINFEDLILKKNIADINYSSFGEYVLARFAEDKIDYKLEDIYFDDSYYSLSIKNRAATGSELRWLYRNRMSSYVQKAVQFWYGGKPCCPPWERGFDFIYGQHVAHLWRIYRPRSHEANRRRSLESIFERLCKVSAM